jgi:hypothetical protein
MKIGAIYKWNPEIKRNEHTWKYPEVFKVLKLGRWISIEIIHNYNLWMGPEFYYIKQRDHIYDKNVKYYKQVPKLKAKLLYE